MTTLRTIGKEIHKRRATLFIIDKAEKGECPYALYYKDQRVRRETRIKKEREMKALLKEREIIKLSTEKNLWYPRRKYCGRYNNTENDIKTEIMRQCFRYGFNVKEIAGYFRLTLPPVYRRINVKNISGLSRIDYI